MKKHNYTTTQLKLKISRLKLEIIELCNNITQIYQKKFKPKDSLHIKEILEIITTIFKPKINSKNPWLNQTNSKYSNHTRTAKSNSTLTELILLQYIKNFSLTLINHETKLLNFSKNFTSRAIGKTIAITPGKVVQRNKVMELICYIPPMDHIFAPPILLVPSCINKYYILDLSPHNSLIKWLISQGFLVYVISWVNPKLSADNPLTFNDYIFKGIITAIDFITIHHQHPRLHVAGYCLGGTLLNCAIAYLAKIKDKRIISITNFMTLLNFDHFSLPERLSIHILMLLTQYLSATKKSLSGELLYIFFKGFKSNQILPTQIKPKAKFKSKIINLDLINWNKDSINLSSKMYNFYLKNFCLLNKLVIADGLTLNHITLNLAKITLPNFNVAGSKDKISPWRQVYRSIKSYRGKTKFVLVKAGHIKSLLNPPVETQLSSFKTNLVTPVNPKLWLSQAKNYQGSWWPVWSKWLIKLQSKKISAIKIKQLVGGSNFPKSPGKYVKSTD